MVYCIVEGQSDALILSTIFDRNDVRNVKIIVSEGFPSMPAVARTIMSFMGRRDRVMIVCDDDNFQNGGYGRDMFGFLLRGAMNNNSFRLFTFNPNIDTLLVNPGEEKLPSKNPDEIERRTVENIDAILKDETINQIIAFARQ